MIAFMRLKTIPLYLLKNTLGTSFKFHSNFSFKISNLEKLLPFCKQMLISWSHYLSTSPEAPSQILSQFLQYNNYNETEGAVIHFEKFPNKIYINFSLQLFQNDRIISWVNLKDEY